MPKCFSWSHGRPARAWFLAGLRLLRFHRLAFPTTCHTEDYTWADSARKTVTARQVFMDLQSPLWIAPFGGIDAPEYTVRRFSFP